MELTTLAAPIPQPPQALLQFFHQFLPVSAALMYAIANGMSEKINILIAEKDRIKQSMREHYQLRSPDERPRISLSTKDVRNYGL